ncbi:MAG: M48 family metallopeptidase [Candidatus Sulfobium sp.]
MIEYRIILLAAFLVAQGLEYWLKFLNLGHMKKCGMSVPQGFEGYIDEQTLKKTYEYAVETNSLSVKESLFSSVLLLIFLFGGLLNLYNTWVNSLGLPFILNGIIFFLLLSYLATLLSLPFSLYGTFRIENKYGFNTMTLRLWIIDFLKSTTISTILLVVALAAGFWLIRESPGYWWVFIWGFFFMFSLFMMYISPYVIEPLFNKFTPLEGHELEDRIRDLMERAGIKVSRVFKIDASRRSRHTNAYFSGIGKVKRIVLYDTLLALMDENEIVAVLAHEAGHWKKKHVLKMIAATETIALAVAYISFRLLKIDFLSGIFNIHGASFFARIVVLGFIFSIVSFPATPVFSYFSRRHENEADRFAADLTSTPEWLATALMKLSRDNLSNLHPHPLYAKIYYSHPPVVERVGRLRSRPD